MRPVGIEFFNSGGRTGRWRSGQIDTTKVTVALRNFTNAPNVTRLETSAPGKTFKSVRQSDANRWVAYS
jgi:hypothetical protein